MTLESNSAIVCFSDELPFVGTVDICGLYIFSGGHPSSLGFELHRLFRDASVTAGCSGSGHLVHSGGDMAAQAIAYLKLKSGIKLGRHDEAAVAHGGGMSVFSSTEIETLCNMVDYSYMLFYVAERSIIRMKIATDDVLIFDGDINGFTSEVQSEKLKQCINCKYYEPYVDMDLDSHCMSPGVTGDRSLSSKKSPRRKGGECGDDRKLWRIRRV